MSAPQFAHNLTDKFYFEVELRLQSDFLSAIAFAIEPIAIPIAAHIMPDKNPMASGILLSLIHI